MKDPRYLGRQEILTVAHMGYDQSPGGLSGRPFKCESPRLVPANGAGLDPYWQAHGGSERHFFRSALYTVPRLPGQKMEPGCERLGCRPVAGLEAKRSPDKVTITQSRPKVR